MMKLNQIEEGRWTQYVHMIQTGHTPGFCTKIGHLGPKIHVFGDFQEFYAARGKPIFPKVQVFAQR